MRKLLVVSSLIGVLAFVPSGMVWAAAKAGKAANADKPVPQAQETAESPVVGSADAGHKIYKAICVHCHRLDFQTSEVGAPGLRDVTHRHDVQWIEHWITSPREFAKVDPSAKALVASNPYGLTMPTLPEMQSAQNRADIIAFLKTLEVKSKK